jgi:hypothetical protein
MELPQHVKPGKIAIVPYYITAAVSIFIVSLMLLLSVPELQGHFFQPRLLAITHLMVFGWATMIIMGASNQLMPVIADNKLHSDRLPVVSFILLTIGTCLLVHSFLGFQLGIPIFIGAFLILTALIIHSVNIYFTATRSITNNIIIDFILTAHLWLIVTALIGLTLLFNFRLSFLPDDHLYYLKVHASAGMAGWFLLLVIGVSSRLVPMYLLSRKEVKKYLTVTYYCINTGIILFLLDSMILRTSFGVYINIILVLTGIAFYLAYIRECYKSAMRKKQDWGLKSSFLAIIALILPLILLAVAVLYRHDTPVSVITTYGYSFFGGFITLLIMGQTFKTLPFIVWMHLTSPNKLPVIQPKDLFKEQLVKLQTALYLPGFLLILSGVLFKSTPVLYTGAVLAMASAAIYLGHVLYVINQLRNDRYRNY